MFCPQSVFPHSACLSEQTQIISQYSINWLVFYDEWFQQAARIKSLYIKAILIFSWLKE